MTDARETLADRASGAGGSAAGEVQAAAVTVPSLEGYRRLRESVGLLDFSGRGILRLKGLEAASFLQGLVTSDVVKLATGQARRAAVLTPTGKIFAMLHALRVAEDELVLLLHSPSAGALLELLERYHFSEDVQIEDLTPELRWLSLQGPAAPRTVVAALASRGFSVADAVPDADGIHALACPEGRLLVARLDEVGLPGFHLLVDARSAEGLRQDLERAAGEEGGGGASLEDWTVCRVEAGVPWEGAELDETVLPMEAGLQAILDHDKGCYVGQEVVARATVQGRLNWSLWGLRLPVASSVTPGQELYAATRPRPVVRVRTVVRSPAVPDLLALAFVHREVARPGPLPVRAAAGGREMEIVLQELPFPHTRRP